LGGVGTGVAVGEAAPRVEVTIHYCLHEFTGTGVFAFCLSPVQSPQARNVFIVASAPPGYSTAALCVTC